jgi:hypothetical protein
VRALLQAEFGDGGGGYSLAGRPFSLPAAGSEERRIARLANRWMLTHGSDGLYGLGGVSVSTTLRGQSGYLEASAPAGAVLSAAARRS